MPGTQEPKCARCWASTPVTDKKFFCMFPSCPYRKGADPFGEKGDRRRAVWKKLLSRRKKELPRR